MNDTKIILELLKSVLDGNIVDVDKVTMEADLCNDLYMDFVDYFDLATILEENYEISLPDEMETFKTIGDIVNYINDRYIF